MTVYNYDPTGKLIQSIVYDSDLNLNKSGSYILYDPETSKVRMAFNSFDYTSPSGTIDDDTYCSYTYSSTTGNIEQLRTSGTSITGTIDPDYDNLGRSKSRTLDYNIGGNDAFYNKLTYSYYSNSGYTSGRISQVSSEIRKGSNTSVLSTSTYKYTYDSNGNITEIRDANDVIQYRYTYDSLGQLIREDNRPLDRSVEYEYDRAGNIQYIYTYNGFTTGSLSGDFDDSAEFNYGDSTWKDLVTEADGSYITYDGIGNPVTIGQTSLTWRGRQLTNYALSSTKNVSYTYNADGIRTSKSYVDGSTTTRHEYTLNGSQIVKETVFTGSTESYTLVYLYDEYGSPIGFRYRTPSYSAGVFDGYFFEKNIQGDVIGIWNQNGTKVVSYVYDAWGNVTVSGTGATGIGAKNPFRYRGYYFDTETNLYYLQTRYYNPSWGRFISADGISYLGADGTLIGYNLFVYCGNNPVNRTDRNGNHWYYLWLDDLIDSINELAASVSNIVYGRAAFERNFYDPKGASDLWNSRPFQETKPSPEMQIFTEFVYNHDFVADISISATIPKTPLYVKAGASRVLSPSKNIDATYTHLGVGASTPTIWSINVTYDVGLVKNVDDKWGYAGSFIDGGVGAIVGFDYCGMKKVRALSFTAGSPYGIYFGYDYYWPIN